MPRSYRHVCVLASNRQRSQDAAEVFERDDLTVVVLADGAGGIRGAAEAGGALVTAVRAAVADRAFALQDADSWTDLFHAADTALAASRAGETTGIVIVLGPRGVMGVSTGDSEAWVIATTHVDDLTAGQYTKARLGSGRATPTTFERGPLTGALIVGTDGLFKYAAMDIIARLVRANDIGRAADQLVELVRLPSGTFADDVAVVLVSGDRDVDASVMGGGLSPCGSLVVPLACCKHGAMPVAFLRTMTDLHPTKTTRRCGMRSGCSSRAKDTSASWSPTPRRPSQSSSG